MRFLRRWLPVFLWIAVILSASNDTFSSKRSSGWAHTLFGFELPFVLHVIVRKSAHMLEYGILAYLAFRAHRTMAVPLLIVLAVSATDEWMQSRTISRTGTIWDVALDVCAGVIVVAILSRTVSQRDVAATEP